METGFVRTTEICPPKNAGEKERVFFNIWRIVDDHGDLHLKGGYYSEGSSTLQREDLDKSPHGAGHGDHTRLNTLANVK